MNEDEILASLTSPDSDQESPEVSDASANESPDEAADTEASQGDDAFPELARFRAAEQEFWSTPARDMTDELRDEYEDAKAAFKAEQLRRHRGN